MTRFWIKIEDAVKFVSKSIEKNGRRRNFCTKNEKHENN